MKDVFQSFHLYEKYPPDTKLPAGRISDQMMPSHEIEDLVRVENLSKFFPITGGFLSIKKTGYIKAVDHVSFTIKKGETLGLVGESGCGKTTVGRTILRLYQPTTGHIYYRGKDLAIIKEGDLRQYRRNMQNIFQDPYASLNPRLTVGNTVIEPLDVHNVGNRKERREWVQELFEMVGLNPCLMDRYPHEFSGGQRQRVGIARAIALHPEFIVCDEPISALDVSIQAQVVNLLEELQDRFGLTYLFIAHDLSMVRHISDRTVVMYLGKTVELAERDELYNNALHPYTQALLSAVPIPDPIKERKRERIVLKGDVPSPANPPSGCRFHERCRLMMDICKEVEPKWREAKPGHWVSCHAV
jgi:oligopeptide transport system ATP-binding protein